MANKGGPVKPSGWLNAVTVAPKDKALTSLGHIFAEAALDVCKGGTYCIDPDTGEMENLLDIASMEEIKKAVHATNGELSLLDYPGCKEAVFPKDRK